LCDAIFLNYAWTEVHLIRTKDIISRYYPGRRHDVFAGIDVFGRGQEAKMDSHKTLAKIRSEDLSVAIFAPGWTLESLQQNVDIEEENGSDVCNLRFLEKNEAFWKTLWPYLSTAAIHSLPFSTSFCLGSGKFENRLGRMVYYGPWFNLAKQELQISVPGISRFYEGELMSWFRSGVYHLSHFQTPSTVVPV
jgi:mannosyl-glycoprotein endo-beta-N-acetylglucosaminidase